MPVTDRCAASTMTANRPPPGGHRSAFEQSVDRRGPAELSAPEGTL